jgi:DNA-binding MarR family transcriptional regulator
MSQRDMSQVSEELRTVVGRLARRARDEDRLPAPQHSALVLLERDGPATTSALAAAAGLRPQSMARTVSVLVESGLVRRTAHPHDARATLLEITRAGRTALRAGRTGKGDWLAEAMRTQLSSRDQQTLDRAVGLLGRLTAG